MRSEDRPIRPSLFARDGIQSLWLATAIATFILIVIGGVVRITGSGLGCGDDWPLCNGQLIPLQGKETLQTLQTAIEYTHRVVAALVSVLVFACVVVMLRKARWLLIPALAALGLIVVQVVLGAITVKVDLHYFAVVPHLSTAMLIFGVLLAGLTISAIGPPLPAQRLSGREQLARRRYNMLAVASAGCFFVVLILGALVANKHAMWVCTDLPVCSVTVLDGILNPLALIQMIHRAVAVLTTLMVCALALLTWRTREEQSLRTVVAWALGLTLLQIGVGAVQVALARSGNTPVVMVMRTLHLAVGAAGWGSIVILATLALRLPVSKGKGKGEQEPERVNQRAAGVEASALTATPRSLIMDYISLTKPGVITLLVFTTFASMLITPAGLPSIGLVVWTMLGGWLMASGAHALNCYFDRDIDLLMGRTSRRPLPSNRLPARHALVLGLILAVVAFVVLICFVNWLAAVLALAGLLYYVLIYTLWLKRTSMSNIVIGGGAGAFPPLVGWAAATGGLTLSSLFLFAIIFYWTPPHFWALAIIRQKDYARAGVPMLPVVAGDDHTRWQILLYTLLMFVLTVMPTPLQLLGVPYLFMAVGLGALFLRYVVRLLRESTPGAAWGLYRFSLLYLALLFIAMVVDRVVFA